MSSTVADTSDDMISWGGENTEVLVRYVELDIRLYANGLTHASRNLNSCSSARSISRGTYMLDDLHTSVPSLHHGCVRGLLAILRSEQNTEPCTLHLLEVPVFMLSNVLLGDDPASCCCRCYRYRAVTRRM